MPDSSYQVAGSKEASYVAIVNAAGDVVTPATVTPVAATAALTSVNDQATTVVLLALNAARKGAICFNDSTSVLYLAYAATASLTAFTAKIAAGGYWEMPMPPYTGILSGIWSADASGAARLTEVS